MVSTFTGPAPRGAYRRPAVIGGDDYTRPLAAIPPYAPPVHPQFGAQPYQPPHLAGRPSLPVPPPWSVAGPRPLPAQGPCGPPHLGRGPRRRAGVWLAAGAAAAMVIAAGAAVGTAAEHRGDHQSSPPVAAPPAPASQQALPPVAPPPVTVADSDLLAMAPVQTHVAEVVGAASLEPMSKVNGPGLLSDYTDPAMCVGSIVPATKTAYAGSGVRATYVQGLHDPDRTTVHLVINAVSTFDSASQAKLFVSTQAVAWQGCVAAPISLDPDDEKPTTWVVRDVGQQGEMVTARAHVRDGGSFCQRALVAKLNVVNDVSVCTDLPSDAAVRLSQDTVARVGQPA